jgi:hypothetical protein
MPPADAGKTSPSSPIDTEPAAAVVIVGKHWKGPERTKPFRYYTLKKHAESLSKGIHKTAFALWG